MSKRRGLDQTDKRILYEIQRSGRINLVDLAALVNLSKSPCYQRLKRLEQENYILGYRADLDPNKIWRGYLVYVQVKLESTKRNALETFNKAVMDVPQILTCHMMSGGYDYLLKIRTRDMTEFRVLLGDVISDLPGVHQTSTFPVMEQVKETTELMIEGLEETKIV